MRFSPSESEDKVAKYALFRRLAQVEIQRVTVYSNPSQGGFYTKL